MTIERFQNQIKPNIYNLLRVKQNKKNVGEEYRPSSSCSKPTIQRPGRGQNPGRWILPQTQICHPMPWGLQYPRLPNINAHQN